MSGHDIDCSFDHAGRTVAITGGAGVLGSEIACALVSWGANVAVLDLDPAAAARVCNRITGGDGRSVAVACDVLDRESLTAAEAVVREAFGPVDTLINAAGGNHPSATTGAERSFFELPADALRWVGELNLLGTILPCQVFGRDMVDKRRGCIVNISSMNAFRPLTRIPAYSAAKAAVSNFTQWLAVHMAREYAPGIRVNAIAPGFFLTEQNRFLLNDPATGELTARGRSIIEHTPMGRFGAPADLVGTVGWLLSRGAAFVTGVVVPVDGGFSAFSGV